MIAQEEKCRKAKNLDEAECFHDEAVNAHKAWWKFLKENADSLLGNSLDD